MAPCPRGAAHSVPDYGSLVGVGVDAGGGAGAPVKGAVALPDRDAVGPGVARSAGVTVKPRPSTAANAASPCATPLQEADAAAGS